MRASPDGSTVPSSRVPCSLAFFVMGMVQRANWISHILLYLDPTRVLPAEVNGRLLGLIKLGDLLVSRDTL